MSGFLLTNWCINTHCHGTVMKTCSPTSPSVCKPSPALSTCRHCFRLLHRLPTALPPLLLPNPPASPSCLTPPCSNSSSNLKTCQHTKSKVRKNYSTNDLQLLHHKIGILGFPWFLNFPSVVLTILYLNVSV